MARRWRCPPETLVPPCAMGASSAPGIARTKSAACATVSASHISSSVASGFTKGARVFHVKFGNGTVAAVDGNKLTIDFDKAGRKMVLESFVSAG